MKLVWFICLVAAVTCYDIPKSFITSDNEFAVDLLQELGQGNKNNVALSGYSLASILALTSLGAKGDTAKQIKKALHHVKDDETLKTEFKSITAELHGTKDMTLATANKIYLGKSFNINSDFAKVASEDFKAGVENVDFSDSKKSAEQMNSWVEKQTNDKIKNLIREDQLSGQTRMVLVNTLYFKGEWQHPFSPSETAKKPFHISKTETVQIDTMKVTAYLQVYRNEKYKCTFIRLPYVGSPKQAVLTLGIPDDLDDIEVVEKQKNMKNLVKEQKYTTQYVTLHLPKFKLEATSDMKPVLQKLGVTSLFENADLSGITSETIHVDAINQKVFIDVNEFGTEAASATAAIASTYSLNTATPVEYHIDRPFLFALLYEDVALINGRVMNPTLSS